PSAFRGVRVLELTEWFRQATFADRPWLILGKGPTFDRRDRFDLTAFNTLALNHVVGVVPVDVAHIVDIGVIGDCADQLLDNCRWLVMPRHPNVANVRHPRLLEDHFDEHPVLRELDRQGRLVWYNLLGSRPEGSSPVIPVRYFSSEAALAILARMGARTVRSLGVDGGRSYSHAFGHLDATTRLANGYQAFDIQFDQMQAIVEQYGLDYP